VKEIKPSGSVNLAGGWKQDVLPGYENEVAQLLSAQKLRELDKIFTNPLGRVTAIKPSPRDMTAAVLTARLSRAGERDVTELFWREFLKDFGESVGDRILNEFGDDSVREDASGYVFVRDASVLTSMQIFRHPLVTGIEASTRYINWAELPLDEFAVWPEKIMGDPEAKEIYTEAVKLSRDAYRQLWQPVWDYVVATNPKEQGQSEAAHKRAVKGAVCDVLRGMLPLGIKTNFGLLGTYRTLTEVVMDAKASDLDETAQIADEIDSEIQKTNPIFAKVTRSEHGAKWTEYRKKINKILKDFGQSDKDWEDQDNGLYVSVEILNKSWSKDLFREALVSRNGQLSSRDNWELNRQFSSNNKLLKLLSEIGGARTNRRHKVPEAINAIVTRVRIENLSFGAFKDLNRHRPLLFKSEPDWTGSRGFVIPREIEEIGGSTRDLYVKEQEQLHEAMSKLRIKFPEESKLLLTHGSKTSVEMVMGGGEDFWITELRSIPSGNPEYREIAAEWYRSLIEEATALKNLGSFVDEKGYTLGRIGEAVKADLRGK